MSSKFENLKSLFSSSRSGWAAATQLITVLENWEAGERKHGNGFRGAIQGLIRAQIVKMLVGAEKDESAAYGLWSMLTDVENAFRKEGDVDTAPPIVRNLLVAMGSFQHEAESLAAKPESLVEGGEGDAESIFDGLPEMVTAPLMNGNSDLMLTLVEVPPIDDSGLALVADEFRAGVKQGQAPVSQGSAFEEMVVKTVSGRGDRDDDLELRDLGPEDSGLISLDDGLGDGPGITVLGPDDSGVIALDDDDDGLPGLADLDELELDLEAESQRIITERRQGRGGSDASLN